MTMSRYGHLVAEVSTKYTCHSRKETILSYRLMFQRRLEANKKNKTRSHVINMLLSVLNGEPLNVNNMNN